MTAGVFLGFWGVVGLVVFMVALRGGRRRSRGAPWAETTRGRRVFRTLLGVICIGFGVLVPALVLAANGNHKAKAAPGGVSLTAAEARGRTLFAQKCATCHTLRAAHAVGKVGPSLDLLHPPQALVLDAIANGRARGKGQMPALLYDGTDAQNVAAFVAAVAGH